MSKKYINVPGRLHNVALDAQGNPQELAGANEIFDDTLGKDQETINSEVAGELSDLGSRVSDTEDALIAEKNRAQGVEATKADKNDTYTKAEVNNIASAFTSQKYATVEATAQTTAATDVLPATGATDTLYRVSMWDGNAYNPSMYSEYTWNGSTYIHMDTKSSVGEVFDITDYNSGTKYPDLAAALDGGNNIPQSLRKGGMSVKFVQSSDNKYVQYVNKSSEFTTSVSEWYCMTEALDKITNVSDIHSVSGQLEKDGNVRTYETVKGKYTDWVDCKEGDVFIYSGSGATPTLTEITNNGQGVSWLFANDNGIVSAWAIRADNYALTIPNGITKIKFASAILASSPNDCPLSVAFGGDKILLRLTYAEDKIENIEETIKINAYNGQSAGDYVVSIDGDNNMRIVSYSQEHFTAKIPLIKGKRYHMPLHDTAGYAGAIANSSREISSGYTFGKNTISGSSYYVGENVSIVGNEIIFICPSDDLYLYINLAVASFDYTDSYYLYYSPLENYAYISNEISAIKSKDIAQDSRLTALENEIGGSGRYSEKVIYVFGDSVTWLGGDNCNGIVSGYDRQHCGWTEYFKAIINPAIMKSYARSGATLVCYSDSQESISDYSGSPSANNIFWNQFKRMANDIANGAPAPDYLLIAGGGNDAFMYESTNPAYAERHAAISHLFDDDVDTALNSSLNDNWYNTKVPSDCTSLPKMLRWLKDAVCSVCPDTQVILLNPLQFSQTSVDIIKQYTEFAEECAEYLSWPTVAQFKECGISELQEGKQWHFTYDGNHTTVKGAKVVGGYLAARLQSIFRIYNNLNE